MDVASGLTLNASPGATGNAFSTESPCELLD